MLVIRSIFVFVNAVHWTILLADILLLNDPSTRKQMMTFCAIETYSCGLNNLYIPLFVILQVFGLVIWFSLAQDGDSESNRLAGEDLDIADSSYQPRVAHTYPKNSGSHGSGRTSNTGYSHTKRASHGNAGNGYKVSGAHSTRNYEDYTSYSNSNHGNSGDYARRDYVDSASYSHSNQQNIGSHYQNDYADSGTYSDDQHGNSGTYSQTNYEDSGTHSDDHYGNSGTYSQKYQDNSKTYSNDQHGNSGTYYQKDDEDSGTYSDDQHGNTGTYYQKNYEDSGSYSDGNYETTGGYSSANSGSYSSSGTDSHGAGNSGYGGYSGTSYAQSNRKYDTPTTYHVKKGPNTSGFGKKRKYKIHRPVTNNHKDILIYADKGGYYEDTTHQNTPRRSGGFVTQNAYYTGIIKPAGYHADGGGPKAKYDGSTNAHNQRRQAPYASHHHRY